MTQWQFHLSDVINRHFKDMKNMANERELTMSINNVKGAGYSSHNHADKNEHEEDIWYHPSVLGHVSRSKPEAEQANATEYQLG